MPRGIMAGAPGAVDEASSSLDTATLFGAFQHIGQIVLDMLKQQEQRAEHNLREALRSQDHKTDQKIQDALRNQKEEAQREIQEVVQQHEQKQNDMREAIREMQVKMEEATQALAEGTRRMEERMRKVEERVQAMERKLNIGIRQGGAEGVDVHGLEERMEKMEVSVQRALDSVFPRVAALVSQLEDRRPPDTPSTPPIASTSALSTSSCQSAARNSSQGSSARMPEPTPPYFSTEERHRWGRRLMDAVEAGRAEDVRRLVNTGASINFSWLGFTPLMKASMVPDMSMVSLLLEMGADVNAKDIFGKTALHVAAQKDFSGECVMLLANAGANVDDVCHDFGGGGTPLHVAATCSNGVAVRVLLAAGASPTAMRIDGRSPYDCATNDIRLLML